MKLPTVTLSGRRTSHHPWIYRRMVRPPSNRLGPGTLVELADRDGAFLGRGIYNPKSEIAVRVLTEDPAEHLGPEFLLGRIRAAAALREDTLRLGEVTDSCRLIHGEADGLSGLIVDRYGDVIVIKPYSGGYVTMLDWLFEALGQYAPGARIVVRADETVAKREWFDADKANARGPSVGRLVIREHDIRMEIDLSTGHKTGYFLDQRENRRYFASLAKGGKVLDCFSYTGGFAISAARAGAAEVTAVDLDEKAVEVAERNAKLNDVKIDFRHRNVFDHLRDLAARGEQVDALVLDPAKLAGVRDELSKARKAYGDLNRMGVGAVRGGGILATFSCSGMISEDEFLSIVSRSAAEAGAVLQIFRIAGAAADHPFTTAFPEGRYLKAVFARVLRPRMARVVDVAREARRAERGR